MKMKNDTEPFGNVCLKCRENVMLKKSGRKLKKIIVLLILKMKV